MCTVQDLVYDFNIHEYIFSCLDLKDAVAFGAANKATDWALQSMAAKWFALPFDGPDSFEQLDVSTIVALGRRGRRRAEKMKGVMFGGKLLETTALREGKSIWKRYEWEMEEGPLDVIMLEFGDHIARANDGECFDTMEPVKGLQVWSVSQMMPLFFKSPSCLTDIGIKAQPKAIELGAGVGLLATCMHHRIQDLTLTDAFPNCVKMLDINTRVNPRGKVKVETLYWGTETAITFRKAHGVYDLVVGADVVYDEDVTELLMQTVAELLAPDGAFLCAYRHRMDSVKDKLFQCAKKHDLQWSVHTPAGITDDNRVLYKFIRSPREAAGA